MSETKTDMMLNGICMVCENKDTLCTHIGQVKEECPFIQKAISTKITNADRIRSMTDEELARALTEDTACKMCEYWGKEIDSCNAPFSFVCTKGYAEALILKWLQSEAE